jgi:hypothetical protein
MPRYLTHSIKIVAIEIEGANGMRESHVGEVIFNAARWINVATEKKERKFK